VAAALRHRFEHGPVDLGRPAAVRVSGRDPSPWLSVPAADYEGHMASPQRGAAPVPERRLRRRARRVPARRGGGAGCATGNGFEHLRPRRSASGAWWAWTSSPTTSHSLARAPRAALPRARAGLRRPGGGSSWSAAPSTSSTPALRWLEYVEPGRWVRRAPPLAGPGGVLRRLLQLPAAGHGKSPRRRSPGCAGSSRDPAGRAGGAARAGARRRARGAARRDHDAARRQGVLHRRLRAGGRRAGRGAAGIAPAGAATFRPAGRSQPENPMPPLTVPDLVPILQMASAAPSSSSRRGLLLLSMTTPPGRVVDTAREMARPLRAAAPERRPSWSPSCAS